MKTEQTKVFLHRRQQEQKIRERCYDERIDKKRRDKKRGISQRKGEVEEIPHQILH